METSGPIQSYLRAAPKAELHVHLEGSIQPATLLTLAKRNGVELPVLTAVLGPARFIPTHKGQGLPAAEIAALPTRSGSMKNPTYFALTPQSFTDFDWLAVLASTAYDRGGPPLQQ